MSILYFGINPEAFAHVDNIEHVPLIETKRLALEEVKEPFQKLSLAKTIFFTSPRAVEYFFACLSTFDLKINSKQNILAIGKRTACPVKRWYKGDIYVAEEETQEGIFAYIQRHKDCSAPFFYPRSTRSRPFLRERLGNAIIDCPLYATTSCKPAVLPPSRSVKGCIFTSPSTVSSFLEFFPKEYLEGKAVYCQGPVTMQVVQQQLNLSRKPEYVQQLLDEKGVFFHKL